MTFNWGGLWDTFRTLDWNKFKYEIERLTHIVA